MNAAFLLVTTAWFAGDTGAAMPVSAAGDCGGASCSTCATDSCGCGGHKLFGKMKGMFKRKDSCGSCDSCSAPRCHAPAATCCEPKPAPCNTCDTCGRGGPKLLDKLRACFHHEKSSCCDGGCGAGNCDSCANGACGGAPYGGTTVMPKAGETIPTPPKKMPNTAPPRNKQVSIYTAPGAAPVSPSIEIAPNAGQVPPAIVPSVESDNLRSPF